MKLRHFRAGDALLSGLEEAGVARGRTRLYVAASEPARRFFEKHGFALLHRRDFALAGVSIHNDAMEKRMRG